jgi:hypothetical protein
LTDTRIAAAETTRLPYTNDATTGVDGDVADG